jgi:peptidoglycan/LPS O-acetylase OafA/YrhL
MTEHPRTSIPAPTRRPTEIGIEGIRGVAALMVAMSHLLWLDLLTPALRLPQWLKDVEGGHAGVLTFFVLSGYVIGWTNPGAFTQDGARSYVLRRLVRLAPIYLIAMILTVAVIQFTGVSESFRVVAGSFLALQNYNGYFGYSLNPPIVNGPLWSLNYELLYYGLFLLLWRLRPKAAWVFGPALVAGILGWFAPRFCPLFIASYASGWLFWAAGWWLSKQPLVHGDGEDPQPLASWVLLIFASHQIGGVVRVFNVLGWYSNDSGMCSIADLGLLPAILLALSAAAHRRLPCRKWISLLAWAVCVIPIAGMICTGRLLGNAAWVNGSIAVVLAALLLPVRSAAWLRPFAWFGGISYAFYVVHFPLLYFVQRLPLPAASVLGFAMRLPIWVALTLGLSWLLERRFQPWIKARLLPRASSRA